MTIYCWFSFSDSKNTVNNLCGARETKRIIDSNNHRNPTSTRERRWSLVSTGWAKYKKKEQILNNRSISIANMVNEDGNSLEEGHANKPISFEKMCLSATNSYDALADRVESLETHISETDGVGSLETHIPETDREESLETHTANTDLVDTLETHIPETERVVSLETHIPETVRVDSLETHVSHLTKSPSSRLTNAIPKKRRSFNKDFLQHTEKKQVLHVSQENDQDIKKNTPLFNGEPEESVNYFPELKTPKPFGYIKDEIDSHHKWVSAKKYFENNPTPLYRKRDQQFSSKRQPLSNTPFIKPLGSHRKMIVDLDDDQCRSSISRLRIENAGMVLAKAKLFEDFNCS